MDKIFHSKQKAMDYANLGGGARSGIPQVDSGSKLYNPTKQAKESKDQRKVKKAETGTPTKKPEKGKIKQDVPQIGALGAFAALGGGLIGGVSMSATQAKAPEIKPKHEIVREVTPEQEGKPEYERKTSVLSGIGEPEIDEGRKLSAQKSTVSGADDDYEDAPTGNLHVLLIYLHNVICCYGGINKILNIKFH